MRWRALQSLVVLLLSALLTSPSAGAAAPSTGSAPELVSLHLFWGEGCPHCEAQLSFIDELVQRHPNLVVHRYEVWRDRTHRRFFHQMATAHGMRSGSVPMLFVGAGAWIGDSPVIRREVEAEVVRCSAAGCPDPAAVVTAPVSGAPEGGAPATAVAERPRQPTTLPLPLVGDIDLALQPLVLSTVLIGLVDGFNPCSLWVLTVLLALVLHSGSRARVAIVGVSFLTTTALIYGLFIAGVFGMMTYVAWLGPLQVFVALFALLVGVVNVKDYFWFQRGLSFTIAPRHKPRIFARIRKLLEPGHSTLSLVAATVLMAAGISLVELPCTAGFPVIWSGLVLDAQPGLMGFAALLGLYLLLYLLIELAVLGVALTTLNISRLEERHGRHLKLLGGMVMVALGLALLLAPHLMNELVSSLLVFGAALAGTVAMMAIHRLIGWRARRAD